MREPVLIVDDNDLNLKLMKLILGSERYEIRTALNGAEALGMLLEFSPRVIVLDLMMPLINGFDLTKLLRSDPRYKGIPIIAVTASVRAQDRESAYAAGVNDFIVKPLDIHRLRESVARALLPAAPT